MSDANQASPELAPERIWAVIRQLLAKRPAMKRQSIVAHELLEALYGPVAPGPQAWRERQAAKASLVDTIATMPGVVYVEGDA